MSGPHQRTLRQLLELTTDASLFSPRGDGIVALVGSRRQLAEAFGISEQALWNRVRSLERAGLMSTGVEALVDVEAITARLDRNVVVSLPSRTKEFADTLEREFVVDLTADGTSVYRKADGTPAQLADLAEAAGHTSLGTTQRHISRLRRHRPPRRRLSSGSATPSHSPAAVDGGGASSPSGTEGWAEELLDDLAGALEALPEDATAPRARLLEAVDEVAALAEQALAIRAQAVSVTACALAVDPEVRDYTNSSRTSSGSSPAFRAPVLEVADAVHSMNEYENDSSHTQFAKRRADFAKSSARNAGATDTPLPPADRALGSRDWCDDDWPELIEPVREAWVEGNDQELRIDRPCLDACASWPKLYVIRAMQFLADDIRRGCDPKDRKEPIHNPGGLLVKAAREGTLRYFPLDEPSPQIDPDARERHRLESCRTRALDGLSQGIDGFSLAKRVLHLAEHNQRPDLHAVEVMVHDLHDAMTSCALRSDFDDELVSLTTSQHTWAGTTDAIQNIVDTSPTPRPASPPSPTEPEGLPEPSSDAGAQVAALRERVGDRRKGTRS